MGKAEGMPCPVLPHQSLPNAVSRFIGLLTTHWQKTLQRLMMSNALEFLTAHAQATGKNLPHRVAHIKTVLFSQVPVKSISQDSLRAAKPTEIARDGVVFNEIANRAGKTNDWIELYNQKATAVKVSDWVLSRVDGAPAVDATEAERKAADAELVKFTGDDEIFIPGKGICSS